MKSNTINFDEKYTPSDENPPEFITMFAVMQSGLTAEQVMNPSEENLQRLIKGFRIQIEPTLEKIKDDTSQWAIGSEGSKVTIVEFKANKDLVKKAGDYWGQDYYSYKGTIQPKDIIKIYPRTFDFIPYKERNSEFYKNFKEMSEKGFDNPLLKTQLSPHMTTLFNRKTQADLENKAENNAAPTVSSSP